MVGFHDEKEMPRENMLGPEFFGLDRHQTVDKLMTRCIRRIKIALLFLSLFVPFRIGIFTGKCVYLVLTLRLREDYGDNFSLMHQHLLENEYGAKVPYR